MNEQKNNKLEISDGTTKQQSLNSEDNRSNRFTLALFLIAVIIIAYLPATKCGYIWDDETHIQNNQTLRSVNGLRDIWLNVKATPQYYPLVHTSYWLEYHLWGLKPTGYHLVNIILHAIGTVLLWRVLKVLQVPGAWVTAMIFGLHPVHVESVAWITERKNVLSGLFYLGAALAYLRYALIPQGKTNNKKPERFYALALFLFICALLSKTVTCTLPAVLLLILWWKSKNITFSDLRDLAPLFIFGACFGLLTLWLEKSTVGAVGQEWQQSFVERCLIAGRALYFYSGKLIWPVKLAFIYPRWQIDTQVWWQYLFPLIAVATIVVFWLARHRLGRGPLVAVLFFAGTLTPALGFFDVYPMRYSYVANHFQYLASIGLIALVVASGCRIMNGPGELRKHITKIAAVFVLIIFGTLTWQNCRNYMDPETLWTDTLEKNPQAWMAHSHMGSILKQRNELKNAIEYYRKAVQINPKYVSGYNNLANILVKQGHLDEAIINYRKALSLEVEYDTASVHSNLATVLAKNGRIDEAITEYKEALKLQPSNPSYYNNLGIALATQNRIDEAVSVFTKALEIKPDSLMTYYNLGNILERSGKLDKAIDNYNKALNLNPDEETRLTVLNRLAMIYSLQKKHDKAIEYLKAILEIKWDQPQVNLRLGDKYFMLGKVDGAIRYWSESLRLNPDQPSLHGKLGKAFFMKGYFDQTVMHWNKALELKPDTPGLLNDFAWILATNKDTKIRNPEKALTMAKKACELTGFQQINFLDTLSVAYAANNNFEKAIQTTQKAINLTLTNQQIQQVEELKKKLELYKAGKQHSE